MAINKIVYGGDILADLTYDQISQSKVLNGKKFYYKNGTIQTGTLLNDYPSTLAIECYDSQRPAPPIINNVNKVIFNNNTLLDMTGIDVEEKDVALNTMFHKKDGSISYGTFPDSISVNGVFSITENLTTDDGENLTTDDGENLEAVVATYERDASRTDMDYVDGFLVKTRYYKKK